MQPEEIALVTGLVGLAFAPHGVRAWLRRREARVVTELFDALTETWELESRTFSALRSRTRVLKGTRRGRVVRISHHVHAGFASGFLPWGIMSHVIVETPNTGGMTAGPERARTWVFFSQGDDLFVQAHAKFAQRMGATPGRDGVTFCPGVRVSREAASARPPEDDVALLTRTVGHGAGVLSNDSASVWKRVYRGEGAPSVEDVAALFDDAVAIAELSERSDHSVM